MSPSDWRRTSTSTRGIRRSPTTRSCRASNRGVSLFTQQGLHLIADLNGWYLGHADRRLCLRRRSTRPSGRRSPRRQRAIDRHVAAGRHGTESRRRGQPRHRGDVERHSASWRRPATSCCSGTAPRTARRSGTSTASRSAASSASIGDDGHSYNYVVVRQDVTVPNFSVINNIGSSPDLPRCNSLPARHRDSVTFRWVTTRSPRQRHLRYAVAAIDRAPAAASPTTRRSPRRCGRSAWPSPR